MKKKVIGIIIAVVVSLAAVAAGIGYAVSEKDVEPVNDFEFENDIDAVDYYGCPNSKRVKKLLLMKKKYKQN